MAEVISTHISAATLRAVSLSAADVQATINLSTNGDTVVLPAGTAIWNNQVTIMKAITVAGAGVGLTIITNNQIANVSQAGSGVAFTITCSSNGLTRLTGIELNGNKIGGGLFVNGPKWTPLRIDNCKFIHIAAEVVPVWSLVSACIDHCTFIDNYLCVTAYGGGYMNPSWVDPLTLGTTNCVVTEDCTFLYYDWDPWNGNGSVVASGGQGMRAVFRHNRFTNFNANMSFYPVLDAHGNQDIVTNNFGNLRGTRQFEVYGNIFYSNNNNPDKFCRLTHLRGGTIVVFDNVYLGSQMDTSIYCQEEDGPSRFNWLTNYPGYDQHWLWIWNNTVNGNLINQLSYSDPSDARFLIQGVNVFWVPKPGYAPLVYPHPLVTGKTTANADAKLNCVASFKRVPASFAVSFSSIGSSSPTGVSLTYFWTFGDGSVSTEENPAHTYPGPGTYAAQLSVSDGKQTASRSAIVVLAAP